MQGSYQALLLLLCLGMTGCDASPDSSCTTRYVLQVHPASAVVNSSLKPPGNQQQFEASSTVEVVGKAQGCAVPALSIKEYPQWTNPDPVHITISSANDDTNGTAVCSGPAAGAVTLTASTDSAIQAMTASVQLTCQ